MNAYRYVNPIRLTTGDFAKFTIGDIYFFDSSEDDDGYGFLYDDGNMHYMPHPSAGRDEFDGWDTGDYFEEVNNEC